MGYPPARVEIAPAITRGKLSRGPRYQAVPAATATKAIRTISCQSSACSCSPPCSFRPGSAPPPRGRATVPGAFALTTWEVEASPDFTSMFISRSDIKAPFALSTAFKILDLLQVGSYDLNQLFRGGRLLGILAVVRIEHMKP